LRTAIADLEIYCPAEHDESLSIAYRKGYLTIDELLNVDCEIISRRNVVLVYCPDGYISGGMWIEIEYAQTHIIPVRIVRTLGDAAEMVNQLIMERNDE